jgi:heat shock protein HtpX
MQQLSREELAGVIAHELAHFRNHDTLLMTITATIAGAISMLAQFGMFFGGHRDNNNGPGIIGSIAMMILDPVRRHACADGDQPDPRIRRRRSRSRASAGQPMWLASGACRKSKMPRIRSRTWKPSAIRRPAHMFIINPLSGQGMDNLFTTPPSTETAIAALAAARGANGRAGRIAFRERPRQPIRAAAVGPALRPRADRGG